MPNPLQSVTEVYAKVAKDREGFPLAIPIYLTEEQKEVLQVAIQAGVGPFALTEAILLGAKSAENELPKDF